MKRIAAIITEYRPLSHADVLVGKFLQGFPCDDGLHPPRVQVASMYLDQIPENDMGVAMAAKFGVPIFATIPEALRLGGEQVAVDGVLIVGEHGDYPLNEMGQKEYPRLRFFEEVVEVLGQEGQSLPVFNDKHLSYHWPSASWMYEAAKSLRLPYMAGSSLPLAWRRPFLELPLGVDIDAAVAIGYGPVESYGFHILETLQCMVERRQGGETGVERVRCLEGPAVWEWLRESPIHAELAREAGERIREATVSWERVQEAVSEPVAFVVMYNDGLEALALNLNGYSKGWAYASQGRDGATSSCEVILQGGGAHAHFSYLGRNVEEMFVTGKPSYPVERTLLTTGILAAAMESRYREHVTLATPHLAICYDPAPAPPYRPLGPEPSGASVAPWPPK
jgi:hypothetical protein